MCGDGAAHQLVGHGDVGHLRRHAHHEREIDEVPVVGFVVAGEDHPASAAAMIIFVRVMQGKDGVDRAPRQCDCDR